jgi:hypothetical protein
MMELQLLPVKWFWSFLFELFCTYIVLWWIIWFWCKKGDGARFLVKIDNIANKKWKLTLEQWKKQIFILFLHEKLFFINSIIGILQISKLFSDMSFTL